jgi:hypothetical protein
MIKDEYRFLETEYDDLRKAFCKFSSKAGDIFDMENVPDSQSALLDNIIMTVSSRLNKLKKHADSKPPSSNFNCSSIFATINCPPTWSKKQRKSIKNFEHKLRGMSPHIQLQMVVDWAALNFKEFCERFNVECGDLILILNNEISIPDKLCEDIKRGYKLESFPAYLTPPQKKKYEKVLKGKKK